jgi:hypothetical protein
MTVKTNFAQATSYMAIDLVNQFNALFTDGVINMTLGVTANSVANMSVNVAAGSSLMNGLFLNNDTIINLLITSNSSGYNRIDLVVADMDLNKIWVLVGTANASPVAPTITGNQVALAQILVGNSVSTITTANITDVRVNIDFCNASARYGNISVKMSDGGGAGIAPNSNCGYILFAQDRGGPNFLIAMGYKVGTGNSPIFQTISTGTLSLGSTNSIGTQVINGGTSANIKTYCICLSV